MTRPEAINTLKKLYATFDAIHETTDFEDGREEMEALDLAIEALKKLDRGYIDKSLLMFLALGYPAPEDAPDDWFHHGDENLDAWRAYIMKCKERGYYEIPMIDGQAYWQTEDGRKTKAEYSVYCSKCGSWSEYRTKYCGNCGSLMKEENDDR